MVAETSETHDSVEKEDWMSRLSRHRSGMALLSFGESTLVPIPLEAIVVPLMVGHPRRALSIATAIWLGCIVGASLFYFVGLWLAEPVVFPLLDWLGVRDQLSDIQSRLEGEGLFLTVFLISLLPAPMQLATLGAGITKGNFLVFIAAIVLSRGIRYFGLAIVAQFAGERLANMDIPKRYLVPGMMIVFAIIWGILQLI